MKAHRISILLTAFVLLIGCGPNPAPIQAPHNPTGNAGPGIAARPAIGPGAEHHVLWGYYTLSFDLENLVVEAIPNRGALTHWNITGLVSPPQCYDCLTLLITAHNHGTKTIFVEVTLKNKTGTTGYDVRGLLLPKMQGVRLLNADSYTELWNSGSVYERNPFLAFAKGVTKRAFEPLTSHTRTYKINYDSKEALGNIGYAVDASWPNNCGEPYEIKLPEAPEFVGANQVTIEVDVPDWQNNVDWVRVYPYPLALADDQKSLLMSNTSGDTWSVTFANTNGAPEGKYLLWFKAKSDYEDTLIWHVMQVAVKSPPPPPTNVQVRFYVACDIDGWLPYYEDPFLGPIMFSYMDANWMKFMSNQFWNKYGFNLVDNGTYKVMDDEPWYDWQFYYIDNFDEVFEMHYYYGEYYAPECLSIYFVQGMPWDFGPAVCFWDSWVDSLAEHKSENVFFVLDPYTWWWSEVMAHESGHAFGVFEDMYLIDPDSGYYCDDLKYDSPPWFQHLFCDDNAYYEGNLMMGPIGGSIDLYSLSDAQADWVVSFNNNYPNNW